MHTPHRQGLSIPPHAATGWFCLLLLTLVFTTPQADADWEKLRVTTDENGVLVDWNPNGASNGLGDRSDEVKLRRREAKPDFREKVRWQWPGLPPNADLLIDPTAGALPDGSTSFLDSTIATGTRYEFNLSFPSGSSAGSTTQMTFSAGREVALRDKMSRIIVVVEEGLQAPLERELERFEMDLVGDGWEVVRVIHERDPGFKTLTDVPESQEALRAKIIAAYEDDPDNTKAVFLLGRLPIVMSGNVGPDGHGSRPHMTDQFYGDMDGTWTDTQHLKDPVNWNGAAQNLPGDGRYDQNIVPGNGSELQVGRVDMAGFDSDMLALAGKTELGMTRNYLRKDHVFRNKYIHVPNDMVNSQWQYGRYEQNQARMITDAEVSSRNRFENMGDEGPFLLGVGYMNPGGDLVTKKFPMVFHHNHKSYVQEHWKSNNPHRSVLAADDYSLTAVMGGWYPWVLHPMSMGATIGESFLDGATYNRSDSGGFFETYGHDIFLNLVGDPTLRLYPVGKPRNPSLSRQDSANVLAWQVPNDDNITGYHVYRATDRKGPYARLTNEPVTGTSFTDAALDGVTYMIRAVKLQEVKTGSFHQASQGVYAEIGPDGTIDNAPVARDQQFTVTWGETLTQALNVSDTDGDELLFDLAEKPAHGTVSLDGGTFSFTPDMQFAGADRFSYSAFDGLNSVEATVEIMIEASPLPPEALPENFEIVAGEPFDSGTVTVLDNDSDLNGDALTAVLVDDVSHGTLNLNPDGTFTYESGPSFPGVDTFTYSASDGTLLSEPSTVTLFELNDELAILNSGVLETYLPEVLAGQADNSTTRLIGSRQVEITGNGWYSFDLTNIDIAEDTVLSLRFSNSVEGEIHGIGFSNDLSIDPDSSIQFAGSQDWATHNLDDYDPERPSIKRYDIPVGDYFTGNFRYLLLMHDDDGDAAAVATYSDIRIYRPNAITKWADAMGLDPMTNARMGDDPNNDGKPNLYHFALALHPLSASSAMGPRLKQQVIDDSADKYLTLTLPFRSGATFSGNPLTSEPVDGIVYTIYGDSDLAPPMGDLNVQEVTPPQSSGMPALEDLNDLPGPDWEYRTFRISSPVQSIGIGFIWIEVSEAP